MSLSSKYHTVILGGGLTGLSIAKNLKNDHLIVERSDFAGGLCRSIKKDGFIFDYTGHWLHLRNPWTKRFVLKVLKKNLLKIKREAWIYSEDVFTKYPYQLNLFGLSQKTIYDCINGLIEASIISRQSLKPSGSFYDWSLKTFGEGITKYFLKPYNEKLWRKSLKKITAEWTGDFVPVPNISDVLVGAFIGTDKNIGYNASFFYPENGGIQSLIDALLESKPDIIYNKEPQRVDIKNRYVILSSGEKISYENLISTIPLPEFLKTIGEEKFAKKLDWTSILCFNLGVKGDAGHRMHWVYFPEKRYVFYRVGFYSNVVKTLAPSGHYSMYVEVSYKRDIKLRLIDVLSRVVDDLISVGFLKTRRDITTVNILPIKYGYVIYDKNRTAVIKEVKRFLEKHNVYLAGRYGGWKYSYMEESILEGKAIADKINKIKI